MATLKYGTHTCNWICKIKKLLDIKHDSWYYVSGNIGVYMPGRMFSHPEEYFRRISKGKNE